ncbi:glycosyltransferase family 25 protein [Vibrio barjaei]|uniref:glycosyltransferase family 25 protein n=1 Tax=Vibrio barjaei TaxID=1676683 RepID=UPI003990D09C
MFVNILVISLWDSEDRRQRVKTTFNELDVSLTFFDAIEGRIKLPRNMEACSGRTHRKWF